MSAETIGLISGLLVVASAIPYGIRTYQQKIRPNLTSWTLWTLIGFALLLTYKSSGAKANLWPAVFGFINPLLISLVAYRRHSKWAKLNKIEIACLVFGLLSFGLWFVVRRNENLTQYALYIAILADACAAIPTIVFVWTEPNGDRPFAWGFFSIAYGLAIFAITEHTFANYVLPLYMFFGGLSITLPLILYRLREKTPLSEWI